MTASAVNLPADIAPVPDPTTKALETIGFMMAGTVLRPDDLVMLRHWVTLARTERLEAMHVLDPNIPEQGLVDACRQVKQAGALLLSKDGVAVPRELWTRVLHTLNAAWGMSNPALLDAVEYEAQAIAGHASELLEDIECAGLLTDGGG